MANKGSKPLAAIYAQALYEAANLASGDTRERVAAELASIKEILEKNKRVGIFLETPTIAFADKRKVIEACFVNFTAVTRNFLLVIAQRGRASMLEQIADAYTEYANRTAGIAKVEVQTARALATEERTRVSEIMAAKLNKKIILSEHVNPDLIGGMVLVHDDKMWDGSLRRTLDDAIKTMEIKTNLVKWSE